MKPAPVKYHDPSTIAEVCNLSASLENARLLAGGQSLMPMINFRYAQPDHLIDLNKVGSLAGIRIADTELSLGAMTRQREIEFSKDIDRACPILKAALQHVGHRQTRNRGTIGGSLCHLDPSAELLNCVSVLDGVLHAQSKAGKRDIAVSDFVAGYMTPSLAPDELLIGVTLPVWPDTHGYAFEEVARRKGDFAIAGVAVVLEIEPSRGTIKRCAISVAGLQPAPLRPRQLERQLVGERPNAETFRTAAAAMEVPEALSDSYVSADYRMHLARVLTRRALVAAWRKAEERAHV